MVKQNEHSLEELQRRAGIIRETMDHKSVLNKFMTVYKEIDYIHDYIKNRQLSKKDIDTIERKMNRIKERINDLW